MTRLKQRLLLLLTILSIGAGVVMLWFAIGGALARAQHVPSLFLAAAVLNAITLLWYLRLIQTSSDLTADQKNIWTIGVFLGLGVGQLLYFARHVNRNGSSSK